MLGLGPFDKTIWRNSDERFALRGRYYTPYDEAMDTDGRYVGEVIVLRTWGLHGGRVQVTVECLRKEASWIYIQLLRAIDLDFPEAQIFAWSEIELSAGSGKEAADTRTRQGGPTVKTQERARVMRQIVDKHPDWGQLKVALEAREELGDAYITEDTVRYVWRQMGWEWSDRQTPAREVK